MNKIKIKSKTNTVSVYLTEDEYKELIRVTDEKNVSLTDYLTDAMYLKFRLDVDEIDIPLNDYNKILKDLKWNCNLLTQLGAEAETGTRELAIEVRNMTFEVASLLKEFRIQSLKNDKDKSYE